MAISYLRQTYPVPFIGIEPAIKPASLNTQTQHIGILATRGTLNSALFANTSRSLHHAIKITEQVGDGLVELIENGQLHSKEMTSLLQKHLSVFQQCNIDHLVLGCTHYPYLIPQIQEMIGPNITIIDSGNAVAKQTKRVLTKLKLLQTSSKSACHQFYTNQNSRVLAHLLNNSAKHSIQYLDF